MALLAVAVGGPSLADEGAGGQETPLSIVTRLQARLAEVAMDPKLAGFAKRYEQLLPVVAQTHDAAAMLGARVGPGLAALDDAARARLVEAFQELAAAAWATTSPSRGSFGTPVSKTNGSSATVTSTLSRSGKQPLAFVYQLREQAAGWRIVSASRGGRPILDADPYGPVLARAGPDGLVEMIEDQRVCRAASTPTEVVACLHRVLLHVMKAAGPLGYDGRFARLAPAIGQTHDLALIARLTVGTRRWKKLDEAQRRRFIDTFRRLSVAAYAARFKRFGGESFARVGEKKQKRSVLVTSRLKKADGKEIHFDYLLRRSRGRWAVFNIIVDGVSDLATKRAEYGHVLGTEGFEELMARLERQIRRYEETGRKG